MKLVHNEFYRTGKNGFWPEGNHRHFLEGTGENHEILSQDSVDHGFKAPSLALSRVHITFTV